VFHRFVIGVLQRFPLSCLYREGCSYFPVRKNKLSLDIDPACGWVCSSERDKRPAKLARAAEG
jgi:hypothetical protein